MVGNHPSFLPFKFFCLLPFIAPPYIHVGKTMHFETFFFEFNPSIIMMQKQCKMLQPTIYPTIPYPTISYHTIPYHTIPYPTIPYHTAWQGPLSPACTSPGSLTATVSSPRVRRSSAKAEISLFVPFLCMKPGVINADFLTFFPCYKMGYIRASVTPGPAMPGNIHTAAVFHSLVHLENLPSKLSAAPLNFSDSGKRWV